MLTKTSKKDTYDHPARLSAGAGADASGAGASGAGASVAGASVGASVTGTGAGGTGAGLAAPPRSLRRKDTGQKKPAQAINYMAVDVFGRGPPERLVSWWFPFLKPNKGYQLQKRHTLISRLTK